VPARLSDALPNFAAWGQPQTFRICNSAGLSASPLWLTASSTLALPSLRRAFLGGLNASIHSWTDVFKELLVHTLGAASIGLQGPASPMRPCFPQPRRLHLRGNQQLVGALPEELLQAPAQLVVLDLARSQLLRGTLPARLQLQVRGQSGRGLARACRWAPCWLLHTQLMCSAQLQLQPGMSVVCPDEAPP
jgi:hypothetical protein